MKEIQYKYCDNGNFEDFASGRVLIGKSGMTNFPVRLAQETFCRCLDYLADKQNICIYDPCCGSGYLITTLGFLNYSSIKTIICSDVDNQALEIAAQNLSLLSNTGLDERVKHIESLYQKFGKPSHVEALNSAKQFKNSISNHIFEPNVRAFDADILENNVLGDVSFKADIVFTDIPYGNLVSWQGDGENAANILLENLMPILKPSSVVAICSDKRQKIKHDEYKRLEKYQVGKRKFEILSLR